MKVDEFKDVVSKINNYTDHIYLHVLGEALLHPNLREILEISYQNNLYVNLTVNGTLINKNKELLLKSPAVRQINVSLHAFSNFSEARQTEYLEELVSFIKDIVSLNRIYLSLRFWLGDNEEQVYAKKYLESSLGITITDTTLPILNHVYVSHAEEFVWPEESFSNVAFNYCNGIKNQLAILVDGTVVPCCLDANGEVNLGNIFDSPLDEILKTNRYQKMLEAFHTHKMEEELCLKCSYKNRFSKS
jgi:radical SAM protein with 4Fe4S-binding SPASM domain